MSIVILYTANIIKHNIAHIKSNKVLLMKEILFRLLMHVGKIWLCLRGCNLSEINSCSVDLL